MREYLPWHRNAFNHSIIADMDGWLSDKEADALCRLAQMCAAEGAIVEIGSWKGKSTVCLVTGSRRGKGKPVYAIDPHTGSSEHGDVRTFDEFTENIRRKGATDMVKPIVARSQDVAKEWNKPVALLWIDGAHEYEYVLQDYLLWEPHLADGGIIAFHDSTMPGPWKVTADHLYKGSKFHSIRFVHGITYATKGKVTPMRNRGMLLLRNLVYALWKCKHFLSAKERS